MKLKEYFGMPSGAITLVLSLFNIAFTGAWILVVLWNFDRHFYAAVSSVVLCIIIIVSACFLYIITLVFDTKKFIFTILASISGLCTIVLGILAFFPSLTIGFSGFTIVKLLFGSLIIISSLFIYKKSKDKSKEVQLEIQ